VLPFLLLLAKPSLLDFSVEQWKATPEMRVEDAYKWLFHACLGGEHAVTSEAGPRGWMEREWKTLTPPLPHEKEVVPLRPDGKVVRVNLRPYRARGGDQEFLLAVFVASAREFRGDKREFVAHWHALGTRLHRGKIGRLNYPDWVRLDREAKRDGYPAVEHSEAYLAKYRPAYRVVLGSLYP